MHPPESMRGRINDDDTIDQVAVDGYPLDSQPSSDKGAMLFKAMFDAKTGDDIPMAKSDPNIPRQPAFCDKYPVVLVGHFRPSAAKEAFEYAVKHNVTLVEAMRTRLVQMQSRIVVADTDAKGEVRLFALPYMDDGDAGGIEYFEMPDNCLLWEGKYAPVLRIFDWSLVTFGQGRFRREHPFLSYEDGDLDAAFSGIVELLEEKIARISN